MKVTTSTGVVLDTEGLWSEGLTKWAKDKGLNNIIAATATHPDRSVEYVLIKDGSEIIFAHKGYEDCACHIDILAITKEQIG